MELLQFIFNNYTAEYLFTVFIAIFLVLKFTRVLDDIEETKFFVVGICLSSLLWPIVLAVICGFICVDVANRLQEWITK